MPDIVAGHPAFEVDLAAGGESQVLAFEPVEEVDGGPQMLANDGELGVRDVLAAAAAAASATACGCRSCRTTRPWRTTTSSFQPDLDPRKVKDLATLSFVEDKANVALLGPPGVGKTHIAVALAVAACRAGYSIYFTSLDDMVRHLKAAEDQGRLISKLTSYLRPAVLVVDEVGYQPLERAEANLVFQVISKRYEKGSIILTSNKSFGEVGRRSSATRSWPPRSSTASCTTARSSRSTATATGSRTASKPSNGTPTWPEQWCTQLRTRWRTNRRVRGQASWVKGRRSEARSDRTVETMPLESQRIAVLARSVPVRASWRACSFGG
ncbi:hypothetical protein STENM327S_02392 [Streptomyces tendae]